MVDDSVSWGDTREGSGCFIATAAYGSELAPPVQFLRDFRDEVVLKSRFKIPFERILDVYYRFSPTVARRMQASRPLKHFMKYVIVWPFVALAMACSFLIKVASKK